MAAIASEIPETMKALVLTSTSVPPTVETIPTPKLLPGSALVRVLSTSCISYGRDIMDGTRKYPFPTPLVPGFSAIGRIAVPGPDATLLATGDLVFIDCMVRSRDEPTDVFLAAAHEGFSAGSRKLMSDVWRDWTYAEYARVPLENLTRLDERRLLGAASPSSPGSGGLGYRLPDLNFLATLLVPYGGFRDIGLRAGETVIVAPATGGFGGAAVAVALAMGARVIAMGRSEGGLAKLRKGLAGYADRLATVAITGEVERDLSGLRKAFGGEDDGRRLVADAFFDIGPPQAFASSHIKAAILALRYEGRVSLMGGYREDVAIPHVWIMHRNLRLYGKWMYERADIREMVALLETGVLKLGAAGGARLVGAYPLEQWKEAFDAAVENAGFGEQVVITP